MFPVNEIFLAFLHCVDVKIVQKVNKFRLHLDVAPKVMIKLNELTKDTTRTGGMRRVGREPKCC